MVRTRTCSTQVYTSCVHDGVWVPVGGLSNRFLTVPFDAITVRTRVRYKKDAGYVCMYVVVNFTIQFNSMRPR